MGITSMRNRAIASALLLTIAGPVAAQSTWVSDNADANERCFVNDSFIDTGLIDTGFIDTGSIDTDFIETGEFTYYLNQHRLYASSVLPTVIDNNTVTNGHVAVDTESCTERPAKQSRPPQTQHSALLEVAGRKP